MPETRTVLLAEDEFILLTLMDEILSERFSVILATNGTEAITLLEANREREIHGLVTDIRMPGALGWDVARRARELHPDIAVIYLTGDSLAEWRSWGVPRSRIFGKPARLDDVLEALSALIATPN